MSSYPTEILRGYRIVGYQVIKFRGFNEMSAFINQKMMEMYFSCFISSVVALSDALNHSVNSKSRIEAKLELQSYLPEEIVRYFIA